MMQRELRRQWVWIDCARWEFSESPFTLEKKNIETTSIDAEIDALQLHWWVWCCSMIWSKDSRMEACACYPFILSQSTFWSLALALHLIILDYSWSSLASFTSYSTFSGAALEVWIDRREALPHRHQHRSKGRGKCHLSQHYLSRASLASHSIDVVTSMSISIELHVVLVETSAVESKNLPRLLHGYPCHSFSNAWSGGWGCYHSHPPTFKHWTSIKHERMINGVMPLMNSYSYW